jgi:hypothetical protein
VTETFFADVPPEEVERKGGKPMLIPRGLEGTGTRVAYDRASGLADNISESDYIHRWEMRYLAIGMGRNPDLAGLAAVEKYNTGLLHPAYGAEKTASGKRLDGYIERALDRVGIHEKADYGTTVHGFTEPGAPAVPPWKGPWEQVGPAVKSFAEWNWAYGVRILDTELFTANDATMTAGTFDHAVEVPGHPLLTGYVISDKKTGQYDPFHWAVQIASYAYGEPYLPDDTRPGWRAEVNLKWGLVWQIKGDETVGHILDLEAGWEAAQHAAWVRDYNKRTDLAAPFKPTTFAQRLQACNDTQSLRWLWEITPDAADRHFIESKARDLA